MRRLHTLILSLFIFSGQNTFSQDKSVYKGYIYLQYNGSGIYKPSPRLLLYLPGSKDSNYDSIATGKLEITEAIFEGCKKAIEQKGEIIKDSVMTGQNNFQFVVRSDGETSIFLTQYLSRVRQILSMIGSQLKNMEKATLINSDLKSIPSIILNDNSWKE